jgi:hypothetical protein
MQSIRKTDTFVELAQQKNLRIPANISLLPLPPRARDTRLGSRRSLIVRIGISRAKVFRRADGKGHVAALDKAHFS